MTSAEQMPMHRAWGLLHVHQETNARPEAKPAPPKEEAGVERYEEDADFLVDPHYAQAEAELNNHGR